jgi:hypothetical protein
MGGRYYLVQKAKDSQVFGIVVGTLGVSKYLSVINTMQQLISLAGKKSYVLSVGKLNVAKLANFAEVDMCVLVSCPESALVRGLPLLLLLFSPPLFSCFTAAKINLEHTVYLQQKYVFFFQNSISSCTLFLFYAWRCLSFRTFSPFFSFVNILRFSVSILYVDGSFRVHL